MVLIAKEKELKVRKITPASAGIQRKATLVAMQLWLKTRTQKEVNSNSYGNGNYLTSKHGKNNQKQAHTNQLLTNTKHLQSAKKNHANDISNNTIDPPTTPQPATQENLGIPFQQTRSTRMSSPSKDSEQFGENDGSELSATLSQQSQSLLQPGGTLLGKDMPDATKVDWAQPASAYSPVSFVSAKILVQNAPWLDTSAKPSQERGNSLVLRQYHEPKAIVLCPFTANKQYHFLDVVTPADVQLAIASMGYVMKEIHEAKMQPAIEIYLPSNQETRIAVMYLTPQTRTWSIRMSQSNQNFISRLTEKMEALLELHSITSVTAGGTVLSIPHLGGYQHQLTFASTVLADMCPGIPQGNQAATGKQTQNEGYRLTCPNNKGCTIVVTVNHGATSNKGPNIKVDGRSPWRMHIVAGLVLATRELQNTVFNPPVNPALLLPPLDESSLLNQGGESEEKSQPRAPALAGGAGIALAQDIHAEIYMQIAQATINGASATKAKRQGSGGQKAEAIKVAEMAAEQKVAVAKMLTQALGLIIFREVKVQAGVLPPVAASMSSADDAVGPQYKAKVHSFIEKVRSDITAIKRSDIPSYLTMTEDQKTIIKALATPDGDQNQHVQRLEQQTKLYLEAFTAATAELKQRVVQHQVSASPEMTKQPVEGSSSTPALPEEGKTPATAIRIKQEPVDDRTVLQN
jgi:hypothetical protein